MGTFQTGEVRTGDKLNVDHRKKLKPLAASAVFATNGLISPKPILRTIVIETKWRCCFVASSKLR
jgi:hypothetical protein